MSYFLKRKKSTRAETAAPIWTAKKMRGFPSIKKKSLKFIFANPARSMLGGSPMRVAAPCRFALIAIPMKRGTGLMSHFFEIDMAIGATRSTTATFSMAADRRPVKTQMRTMAAPDVLGPGGEEGGEIIGHLREEEDLAHEEHPEVEHDHVPVDRPQGLQGTEEPEGEKDDRGAPHHDGLVVVEEDDEGVRGEEDRIVKSFGFGTNMVDLSAVSNTSRRMRGCLSPAIPLKIPPSPDGVNE